ncbi:MAG: TRAP transporter small permease subunit [Deltaproteobacteria bacterium]|nr:TRAP transporter small permease subunit [Deltaproteobacteria bacterium]
MEGLDKLTRNISRYLEGIGAIFFLVMFFANLVDVVGAKFFGWPLPGALEIISFAQVVAISFAIAFGLYLGTHLKIEFIADKLPFSIKKILDTFVSLCCLTLFFILFIYGLKYAKSLQISGEMGSVLKLPLYPLAYAFAISLVPVILYYIIELVKNVRMKR